VVGSLVLGLHDDAGALQHVGVAASFPMARRKELVAELEPYLLPRARRTRGSARRSRAAPRRRAVALEPRQGHELRAAAPELVVEVAYDHMEGARFRHTAQFRSWRPDRDAASCTYAQLDRRCASTSGRVLGA
jgi:ATP-dependent DNA ligase